MVERHAGLHRFVQKLIAFRLNLEATKDDHGLTLRKFLQRSQRQWHGVRLQQPDWDEDSHTIAFTVWSLSGHRMFHFMVNSYWQPLDFELPAEMGGTTDQMEGVSLAPGKTQEQAAIGWRRLIDTFRAALVGGPASYRLPLHHAGTFSGAAGTVDEYLILDDERQCPFNVVIGNKPPMKGRDSSPSRCSYSNKS